MKKRIRVLALIMTLAVLLSSLVIVVPVSAEGASNAAEPFLNKTSDGAPWTNFAATSFAAGTGSASDPYQIATAAQLALLAKLVNDTTTSASYNTKYYVLIDDIDLAGHEWVSIASTTNTTYRFFGNFEGNGHMIKNMTYTRATSITGPSNLVGLFGYIGGGKNIQNFTLTGSVDIDHGHSGATPAGMAYVAMVVAHCSGSCRITNVDVYGEMVVRSNKTNLLPVAGILGRAHSAIVSNCTMNGSIEVITPGGVIPSAAGIVGTHTKALQINSCTNNADITVYANGTNSIAGGIVAYCGTISHEANFDNKPSDYEVRITNCVNNGNVTAAKSPNGNAAPNNQRIGGIIGNLGRDINYPKKAYPDVTVENCINTGSIELGEGVTLGGGSAACQIIGWIEGKDGKYCKVTLSGCFVPSSNYTSLASYDFKTSSVPINGNTIQGGYGYSPNRQTSLAADVTVKGDDATIRISKTMTEIFLSSGYSMELTYGDFEMNVEKGTADFTTLSAFGKIVAEEFAYAITVPAQKDAVASMRLQNTFLKGTPVERTFNVVASQGTWADFYTAEWKVNPFIDADDYAPGSKENPYLISTAEELAMISAYVARDGEDGKYFSIVNDIDLSAHEWLPIGDSYGTILGHGHTISGLTLTSDQYAGAQAFISDSKWNIKDLTFTDVRIETANVTNVSPVIGVMKGGTLENVRVLSGKIDVAENATVNVGGLVAKATAGTIKDCLVNLEVNASEKLVASGTATMEGENTFVDLALKSENSASLYMTPESIQNSGMAFTVTYDQTVYDQLTAMGYTFSFGTVIATTEKFESVDGRVSLLKGGYIVSEKFAIKNIKEYLLTKDFSAIPYATLTKDGVSCTIYGSFDPAGGRSVVELVKSVIEDRKPVAEGEYVNEITFDGDYCTDKYSIYTNEQLANLWKIYGELIMASEA